MMKFDRERLHCSQTVEHKQPKMSNLDRILLKDTQAAFFHLHLHQHRTTQTKTLLFSVVLVLFHLHGKVHLKL